MVCTHRTRRPSVNGGFLTKGQCEGLLDVPSDTVRGWEGQGKEVDAAGIGRLSGRGCRAALGGEIDLSPAAKSHCMSLSDGEHYSQSLWINLTAAPHDPPRLPPRQIISFTSGA